MEDADRRFAHRVSSHEMDSQHAPDRFRARTAAMAFAGYAAIWLTLALCALAIAWVVGRWLHGQRMHGWGFMVLFVAGSLMVSVLRALWTPFPAPTGRRLARSEAPALFKMIDKVRQRTGGPAFDEVLIDGDLNAAVVQRPRLGLLGWYRNHLVLGLPLLMLLDQRQLASVIAHEYGHLSGAHGKLGGWVYRTRRSWMRLVELRSDARGGNSIADVALGLFLSVYFPRFNARAFVLGRQQEYEADRAAQQVAGADASAQALIAMGLGSRYLHEVFWPDVFARARSGGELREAPYREMRRLLGKVASRPEAAGWLREDWKRLPDLDDTHPSLRQRLEFAARPAQLPAPVGTAASALALLGASADALVDEQDARWRRENLDAWQDAARWYQVQVARLVELEALQHAGQLTADQALEHARCVRRLRTPVEAQLALEAAHAQHPQHAEIALRLAALRAEDPADAAQAQAFALWTQVTQSDSTLALQAFDQAIAWLERADRHKDAQAWRQRQRERAALEAEAHDERFEFDDAPSFGPAPFDKAQLNPCLGVLIREKAVGAAYLVQKHVSRFPGRPFFVLIVERSRASGQPSPRHFWAALRDRVDLPGEFMVIDCAHPYWKDSAQAAVLQQMKAVRGARIYARA